MLRNIPCITDKEGPCEYDRLTIAHRGEGLIEETAELRADEGERPSPQPPEEDTLNSCSRGGSSKLQRCQGARR